MQTEAFITAIAGHSEDPGYSPSPEDELRALIEDIHQLGALVARIAARPASPTTALLTAMVIEQAQHAIQVAQLKVAQMTRQALVHELPADALTELRSIAQDPTAYMAGEVRLPEDPCTVPTGRLQFKTPADCLAGMTGIDYFEARNRMQGADDLLPGRDSNGLPRGPRYPQLAEQLHTGKTPVGTAAAAARKLEKLRPGIEARPDAAAFSERIESRVAESIAAGDPRKTTKLFDLISDELEDTDPGPTPQEIRNKTGIFITKRTRHYTYFTACMLNLDAEVFLSHFAGSDNARTQAGNRQALAVAVSDRPASAGPATSAHDSEASTRCDEDAGPTTGLEAPTDTDTSPTEATGIASTDDHAPAGPENPTDNRNPEPDPLFPQPSDGPGWFDRLPGAETFDDPPPTGSPETVNGIGTGVELGEPTPAQRHLQTLLNLMRAQKPPPQGTNGLPTSKLFVYITLEVLLGLARGAGWSAHGLEISVAEVRKRLAEFGFIPIVLGGDGQILDYGRERRFPPEPMKQAIRARDRGCLKPGCKVPPEHCEFHHIKPWADGGSTSVWNLGMFCTSEHRAVDKGDIEVVMKNGVPWVKLAPFEDPDQVPRRNTHWQGDQEPLF